MRLRLRNILWAMALLTGLALAGCAEPGLDRVDVTWETDPPPRWGLYPGYRQEIPCPKGAVYRVDVFFKGKAFTGGSVSDTGSALAFQPTAGAKDIEVERDGRNRMALYAILRNENGQSRRLLALRIELKGDKMVFEFPK